MKVTFAPALTVWPCGCVVMAGAVFTVTAALPVRSPACAVQFASVSAVTV